MLEPELTNPPSALSRLCATFGFSPFERDVLVLCAGMELDASFGSLCASAQGDPSRSYPTFSLALAALEGAHWSALTPAAPLRRWRLIDVAGDQPLTQRPLRIDERILHFLAGVQHLDERLCGLVEPASVPEDDLVASHQAIAEELIQAWSHPLGGAARTPIQLHGEDAAGKRAVAAHACNALGWNLNILQAVAVPLPPAELDALLRLLVRESALTGGALLIDCDETDGSDPSRAASISWLVERLSLPLVITTRHRQRNLQRAALCLEVRKPTAAEQRLLWRRLLSAELPRDSADLDTLGSQFSLSTPSIRAACAEAIGHYDVTQRRNRRPLTRGRSPMPHQDCAPCSGMRAASRHVRAWTILHSGSTRWWAGTIWSCRMRNSRSCARSPPTCAAGRRSTRSGGFCPAARAAWASARCSPDPAEPDKTMAAEVLAHELHLDLYRIDLSQVVSKYIGETEKNLSRVFDAAEEGGAVLLFDEADALFGRRTEVKDSHDRYANIEVSFLLQRMEAYRGLAILTTNMKSALDAAFMRRIRFIVQFPFPDVAQRAQIWRGVFPAQTPTEDLDPTRLARLAVAGGNIRNIALNAAFLAADAGQPVRMTHLLKAARSEYAKLEKPLNEMETQGWN